MRLTVVGSGTVVPDPGRACASHLIEASGVRLLLDCGPGATRSMARLGLPWATLTHLAVTHFHTDHIGDLPYLLFALKYGLADPRREAMTLLGPAGIGDRLRALAAAFADYMLEPGFPFDIRELASGDQARLDPVSGESSGAVTVRAFKTFHTDESLAYRVETAGGSLGYTGDTGPDRALANWLAGVDVLVAECSLPESLAWDRHMTPAGIAVLARAAAPRRLVLTHVYPQLERDALPALVREAGWAGEVVVAEDGMTLEL